MPSLQDLLLSPDPPSSSSATAAEATVASDPSIDGDAAVRTVVSILSAHAGRFLKDAALRRRLREKCSAACCLAGPTAKAGGAHAVLVNLGLGMDSIDRLVADGGGGEAGELRIRSLRNSIRLLSVVAEVNGRRRSRNGAGGGGFTGGAANSHLSACAHVYLSIVYKIEKKDRASARHLLQVFCDAPYLARKNLLSDLWDHFFLPHLLHLKVWYAKEVEFISGWDVEFREQRMKGLDRAFNDQMDVGTSRFAVYYKDWIKIGAVEAPPIPSVSLPSSSVSRSLNQTVLVPSLEREDAGDTKIFFERLGETNGGCKVGKSIHSDMGVQQVQSEQNSLPEATQVPRRSYSFRLLSCGSNLDEDSMCHAQISKNEPAKELPLLNIGRAIPLISNSNCISECEEAIRLIAKSWLHSHGESTTVTMFSTPSFIEGLLEVCFASKDDEVLELAISILAELVTRSEVNRQVVLNASPQLDIFLRFLRNNNIFLKAVVVLYLLKPKAKQMLSLDWIPLVLRALDNGDKIQTLFTIQCCPNLAAIYLLDQLIMGFDVDRNMENAKQMVALGGLCVLIRRLELGGPKEKERCASFLAACVQADGSSRDYLVANMKKHSIIQLLQGNQLNSNGSAISLLSELVCIKRTTDMIKFLIGLKNVCCLNTMHVILVYLQQAPLEQRPLAAAILLQIDLLEDTLQFSVYREEGIDAIVVALERSLHNKKFQEKCSRALLLLGGHFSCTGEAMAEAWLLRRAGLDDGLADSYNSKEEEEEKTIEDWLRKLTIVLLTNGNKRFLVALSNCIADGIPSLARSCLVTVAWMSCSLSSSHIANDNINSLACSILAPRLMESLNHDRAIEERVLASLSLLNFVTHSECLPKLFPLDKERLNSLEDLAQVTWTARELIFACCRRSNTFNQAPKTVLEN